MAEILKSYHLENGYPPYPWDEWLDGQIRRLVYGKDFRIKLGHFQISCHARRSRGGSVDAITANHRVEGQDGAGLHAS